MVLLFFIKDISIMKKLYIFSLLTVVIITSYGQSIKLGIKGGVNFSSTGGIASFTNLTDNLSFDSESRLGYHIGGLGKFEFLGLFVQPEIVYTKLNTRFEGNSNINYSLSKIDIPLLVGFDIIGPLNFKIGPSFQYIIENTIRDSITSKDLDSIKSSLTTGYQLGLGINLNRFGLDIRYERAFQENNLIVQNTVFKVDSRPSQWIASISYTLGKNNK